MLRAKKTRTAHAYDLTEAPAGSQSGKPTLVFIHGWLLSRAYWQPLIAQLSPIYRCLSYDLRGFGESAVNASDVNLPRRKKTASSDDDGQLEACITSPYSLAAYARDLGALLDEVGADTVWLVGHSLGGSIALWAAYLQPERVKGVVCVNAGGGIYIPKEFEKFRAAGQQMVKFRPKWLPGLPLLPHLFSRMMVNRPLASHWGKQRLRDFVVAQRAAAEGALLETTTEAEVHLLPQIVGKLTQPVHFIAATEDGIMPPRYVRYLASFHPHFKETETVSEIANCGHMAMVEQPEAVAGIVRAVVGSATGTAQQRQ